MSKKVDTRKVFRVVYVSHSPLATRRMVRILADDAAEAWRHAPKYQKNYELVEQVFAE